MTAKPPAELSAPVELVILAKPKRCTRCKIQSIWGTPRGRAVHPSCEGRADWLTGQAYRQTIGMLCGALAGRIGMERPAPPAAGPPGPCRLPPAPFPCVCGQTQDVIHWLPQDVWRCPPHHPLAVPVLPWEGHGYPGDQPPRTTTKQEEQ